MGIVRDLYMARKIGAGLKLPAPTVASLIKRLTLAKILYSSAEKTETGVLIHIEDALAEPALSVVVNIAPVQNLNGYSKPWPAGGGANQWDCEFEQGNIISDGSDGTSQNYNRTKNYIPVTGGSEYRVICPTAYKRVYWYDADYTFISSDLTQNEVKTAPATAAFARMYWPKNDVSDPSTTCALNYPSSVTVWTPYSNICPITGLTGLSVYVSPTSDVDDATEYTEDWTSPAGTVYGGNIDVVTGVLTVDKAYVDMGTLEWAVIQNEFANFRSVSLKNVIKLPPSTDEGYKVVLSSMYASVPITANGDCYIRSTTSGEIRVKDTTNASLTADQFKTLMSGVQLVYMLATPVTHQLTAQEVQMLLGENYIWASTGDSMRVKYKADGNATPLESLNLMLDNKYRNPGTAEDVSDIEALNILLGR